MPSIKLLLLFAIWAVAQIATIGFKLPGKTRACHLSTLRMHFEEAINGNSLISPASLPADRYLATNRFRVRDGKMAKFEKRWADRKSRLAELPGFRFFSLFKRVPAYGVNFEDEDGYGNYISFTYWEDKSHFDAWRTGEAFKEAHGGGGITDFVKLLGTALFILNGSPKPAFYDALLVNPGETLSFATENGWRNVVSDGQNCIDPDIFMVQNKFKIVRGKEVDFEQQWANRDSKLKEVPGFVGFSLLRRDADKADDGYNYISNVIWKNQRAFETWKSSDAFKSAHLNAGGSEVFYEVPPKMAFYEGKLTLSSPRGI